MFLHRVTSRSLFNDTCSCRWFALVELLSFQELRLCFGKVWALWHGDSRFTLSFVQFVLEVVLHASELGSGFGLVDHGCERELVFYGFLWFVLCSECSLFHTAWHLSASIAFFSFFLDSLLTLQFLLLQVFLVEGERTERGNLVRFEGRALAVAHDTSFGVLVSLGFLLPLFCLPKAEWCFTALCNGYGVLFDFESSFFVRVDDALVSWNQH